MDGVLPVTEAFSNMCSSVKGREMVVTATGAHCRIKFAR